MNTRNLRNDAIVRQLVREILMEGTPSNVVGSFDPRVDVRRYVGFSGLGLALGIDLLKGASVQAAAIFELDCPPSGKWPTDNTNGMGSDAINMTQNYLTQLTLDISKVAETLAACRATSESAKQAGGKPFNQLLIANSAATTVGYKYTASKSVVVDTGQRPAAVIVSDAMSIVDAIVDIFKTMSSNPSDCGDDGTKLRDYIFENFKDAAAVTKLMKDISSAAVSGLTSSMSENMQKVQAWNSENSSSSPMKIKNASGTAFDAATTIGNLITNISSPSSSLSKAITAIK